MPKVHAVKPIFTTPVSISRNTFSHIAVGLWSLQYRQLRDEEQTLLAQSVEVNALGVTFLKQVGYKIRSGDSGL